jgi:uncharacterized protein YjbI with pentapeptide repeats
MQAGINENNSGKKSALIVSISDYDKPTLPKLGFSKNDGDEMGHFLKSQGYEINNALIGRANYEVVKGAIMDFFTNDKIIPEDLLLFYFSGHGIIENKDNHYLATSETDPTKPWDKSYPISELTNMANRSITKNKVLILDCCYSGGAVSSGGTPENAAKLGRGGIESILGGGIKDGCLLASCQAHERSFGTIEPNHSVYTGHLLTALKGIKFETADRKGNVTPKLLSKYLYDAIMRIPVDQRPKQKPIETLLAPDLILVHYDTLMADPDQLEIENLLGLLREDKIAEFNIIRQQHNYPQLYLMGADLNKAKLKEANLKGIILDHSNLEKADLTSANLKYTSLRHANLRNSRIFGASIVDSNLEEADLRGADILGASIVDSSLQGADLREAQLIGVNFYGVTSFVRAKLQNARILGSRFNGTINFAEAELNKTFIQGARFSGIVTFLDRENYVNNVTINGVAKYGLVDYKFDTDDKDSNKIEIIDYIPINDYEECLETFEKLLSNKFSSPEFARKLVPIKQSILILKRELEDITYKEKLDEERKASIEFKIGSLIKKIFNILGEQDAAAILLNLDPFYKLTVKSLQDFIPGKKEGM